MKTSFKRLVNEAEFSGKDVGNVSAKLATLIAKQTGESVWQYGGPGYVQVTDKYTGQLYFLGDAEPQKAFRTNFKGGQIVSFDIWDDWKYGAKPLHHITFDVKDNIVDVVETIIPLLKNPSMNVDELRSAGVLTEARVTPEEFMKLARSMPVYKGRDNLTQREMEDVSKRFDVNIPFVLRQNRIINRSPGKPEVELEPKAEVENNQKLQEKIPVSELFEDLAIATKAVVDKSLPALIVSGSPGSGKTHTVLEVVKQAGLTEGQDFIMVKGNITTAMLYTNLFYYRNRLVLFDDTDGIFKDDVSVNILKAALDSSGVRKISWHTKKVKNVSGWSQKRRDAYNNLLDAAFFGGFADGVQDDEDDKPESDNVFDQAGEEAESSDENPDQMKLPSEFSFQGSIIFISNLSKTQLSSKGMAAVMSRSMFIDVTLTSEEILERLKLVMDGIQIYTVDGKPIPVPPEAKADVYNYMMENIKSGKLTMPSIRTFVNILKVRMSNSSAWQRMARYILMAL